MENQKQKKSVATIALVVLLLIVTIASLILATYAWAKYSRRESGSAVANVAKWDVDISANSDSFTQQYSHVVNEKIAPGTQGSFDVSIALNDTEVCVAYQVILNGVQYTTTATDGNSNSLLDATKMSHLKFFTTKSGDTYTGLLTPTVLGPNDSPAANGSGVIAISGVMDLSDLMDQQVLVKNDAALPYAQDNSTKNANVPGASAAVLQVPAQGQTATSSDESTKITRDANDKVVVTKTIYWVWPYDLADAANKYGFANVAETSATDIANVTDAEKENYDLVDTAAGEGAVEKMELFFTVKAWQVAPDDASELIENSKTQKTNMPSTDIVDGNPTEVPAPAQDPEPGSGD